MIGQFQIPYPIDCLGPLGSDFARCVAHNAQAKNALVGPVILAAMSSAVHGVVDIKTSMHSVIPTSLYVCVVAASGMRKSTVVSRAFHGFREFEDIYESNTNEELQYVSLGSHPYILEDASESGIVDHFHNGAKASALVLDEGGMLKARLDNQRMCKRFDGADLRVTRHNRMIIARDTRTTFCMTVQDAVFADLLKSKEGKTMVASGLMPRLLISYASSSVPYLHVPRNENIDPFTHCFHDRVRSLMEEYRAVLQSRRHRAISTLSPEANECWLQASNRWRTSHRFQQQWKGMDSFLARAAEQAIRVAAVLQYFNDPQTVVKASFMESAVKLVDWHLDQALIGFGTRSEEEIQAQYGAELYSYILKKISSERKTTFLRIDLLRSGPANLRKADRLDLAIDHLLKEDKITWFPKGQRKELVYNATPRPGINIINSNVYF